MKKSLLISLLAFSLVLCPFEAFAKKAKNNSSMRAPVVIQTDEEGNIITGNGEEKKEDETPAVNIEELNTKNENVTKKEQSEEINPNEIEVSDKKEEKAEVVSPSEIQTENIMPFPVKKLEINPCNGEIEGFFNKFATLQNNHNLKELRKIYTDDFVNSDGYNKEQLFALMTRTFAGYPDLKTEYEIKEITSNKNFAMATVVQNITATTKDTSKITKDKGTYTATLEDVFYLKKVGKEWKIYAENVLRETSKLAYGMAKDVDAVIFAPQKVLFGNDYSAGVKVFLPEGYSAIASINNTQVVENYNMTGDSFRQVPVDTSVVERVLKANSDNNNEAVVVSVGFTKLSQDMFKKAKMDIAGLMILMQRVDIIPENSNHKVDNARKNSKK